MRNLGVKIKSAYVVTFLTALVFTFLFFYLGINHRKSTYEDSKLIAREISRQASSETEAYIMSALYHARSMASQAAILQKMGAHRDEIAHLLLKTLKSNPNFLAVWTMWEPNLYDGKDSYFMGNPKYDSLGHLSLTYFRWQDIILSENIQVDDYTQDYYTVPKRVRSEIIIEPYFYTYTGHPFEFFETSVVVPIFVDTAFAGVFAIDINLEMLQNTLNKTRLFETGFLSLISNEGIIVSHMDSGLVTKNFFENLSVNDTLTKKIIQLGLEYSMETVSEFSREKVFRFFYPINVGDSDKLWSMMVEIPIEQATTRSKQLLLVAFATLVLGLSLLIYLIINIYDRRRYERTIEEALVKLETSNKQLALSEQKFRDTAELMPQTIWETDIQGKVTFVNRNGADVLGYTMAEVSSGFNIMNAIAPEDRPRALANIQSRLGGNPSKGEEYLAIRKDGTRFPVKIFTSVIVLNNQPQGLRGISIDITEAKKAEEELEMHRNNLEILIKERTEELEATNEELKSINEELFDQRLVLEKALDDLHMAQNKLIQAEKMASLGILASGIAHEINNPLNFIYNGTVIIEEKIQENDPATHQRLKPFFEAISEGSERITSIVKSLNKFCRSESYPISECPIHEAIDDCLLMLQNRYIDRIHIVKKFTGEGAIVMANEGQVRQALLNILVNAIQSISGKGEISITTSVSNNYVAISIADTGCGIPDENSNYIFDPFFTTKDQGQGTGLGLTITQSIVKEHRGTIKYESKINQGTTFVITLPLYKYNHE